MDDKDVESTPNQSKPTVPPFITRRPERRVPHAFNTNPDATAKTDTTTFTAAPRSSTKQKKGLIVGLIVAALLLLGVVLAYVYWFQHPNKVLSDALTHAINAKTLTYTGTVTQTGTSKVVATIDGGFSNDGGILNAKMAFNVNEKKYTLDGNAIIDSKNDIYFRAYNFDALANNFLRVLPEETRKQYDQIYNKIDNKWVKMTSADLRDYSPDMANAQKCTIDTLKKLQNDNAAKSELKSLYEKHPFIMIDKTLGAKDGSLGYTLSTNSQTEASFYREYRNSSIYKSLVKCDDSFTIADKDLTKSHLNIRDKNISTELWVDRWSHRITKVNVHNETDKNKVINVAVEPKFDRPVSINAPKDATTLEQLQKDVMLLLQPAQPAPATPPATE